MTTFFYIVVAVIAACVLVVFLVPEEPPTKTVHYDARLYSWKEYGHHAVIFEGPDRDKPIWTIVRTNIPDEKTTYYTVVHRNPGRPVRIAKAGLGNNVILHLGHIDVPHWLYGKRTIDVVVHNHDGRYRPSELTPVNAPDTDAWRNA